MSRRIASSDKLKRLIVQELNPWKADTDEQNLESMMNTLDSYEHPFATAPMGPNGSKMAVVDFQGKVYKVEGLRVVDASIFPDAVSTAPNLTVIMAA